MPAFSNVSRKRAEHYTPDIFIHDDSDAIVNFDGPDFMIPEAQHPHAIIASPPASKPSSNDMTMVFMGAGMMALGVGALLAKSWSNSRLFRSPATTVTLEKSPETRVILKK